MCQSVKPLLVQTELCQKFNCLKHEGFVLAKAVVKHMDWPIVGNGNCMVAKRVGSVRNRSTIVLQHAAHDVVENEEAVVDDRKGHTANGCC